MAALVALLAAVHCREVDVAKKKAATGARTTRALRDDARAAVTAGDYARAFDLCAALQDKDAAAAHAVRGMAFERQGRTDAAKEEYRASYALGNHVAGGSLAFLNGGGKPGLPGAPGKADGKGGAP